MLRFVDNLISLIFPRRCPFCGNPLLNNKHTCDDCDELLPFVKGETCKRCGRGIDLCCCGNQHFAFELCVATFYYDGDVKQAVKRFKFNGQQGFAPIFAAYTVKTSKQYFVDKSFDFVTSVPLTRRELRNRGYNQSELFGRALAKELSLPYMEALEKPHDIRSQRSCTAAERTLNVTGAFKAKPKLCCKSILLTDDIITTGATLNECAKMLLDAGASEVCCAVFACVASRSKIKK